MPLFKKRLIFILCLLLFLAVDRLAGRYLFAETQPIVEIVFLFFVGCCGVYWAISNERFYRKFGPELQKRKRELLADVQAKHHKQTFKDFLRGLF